MRALDTNILVRFVTKDDPRQAALVHGLFVECERTHERLYISTPVICELIWVLKYGLSQTKLEIILLIDGILDNNLFQIEHKSLVLKAMDQYRQGKADFADYLIGQLGAHAACRDTVSFDRALKNTPGFTLL